MTEEQIERIMVREGWWELEEWRELKELITIMEKESDDNLASEIASARYKKKKIEEKVCFYHRDVK